MALSFSAVQKAYNVFHELKATVIPELNIPSWPTDMAQSNETERKYPNELEVYGWDKKADDGWESIVFFVRNPSIELRESFDQLKKQVPNSSMSDYYSRNKELWIIGWF